MNTANRKDALDRINSGSANIIIGTHALIQEDVDFHKLGLVIVDEQHRFGVMQRATLRNKGIDADVLVMTATPIPRTLAMDSLWRSGCIGNRRDGPPEKYL